MLLVSPKGPFKGLQLYTLPNALIALLVEYLNIVYGGERVFYKVGLLFVDGYI